ncbi:MAG: 2TM domain-containing protein [Chlorogloea purpurea SAG 13.99]|nr:2TM domain-containing protein [Chlorogloea purpurea SAG 13.99]
MPGVNYPSSESYGQEDVQGILSLAISRQIDRGEIDQQELLEIAQELSIDVRELEKAKQDWYNIKLVKNKQQEFIVYRWQKLKNKLVRYLIANGFFITINFISSGSIGWALYILMLWGLPLSLDTWQAWQTGGEEFENQFQQWQLKQEVKQSFLSLWRKIRTVLTALS